MYDTTMTDAALAWAETRPALSGIPVMLEDLPAEGVDAVMVSALTGEAWHKRYKDGGRVASYPFQVVLRRAAADDTASRLEAMRTLGEVARSVEDPSSWPAAPPGVTLLSFDVRTPPVPVAADDTGARDYQVTFEVTYKRED